MEHAGRNEGRLAVVIVVNLAALSPLGADKGERTYTDNISAHGARVHCNIPWQAGEQAEITPVKGEATMRGEVVYCQKLAKGSFFIGLKFRNHVPWLVLPRFDGTQVKEPA